MKPFYLDDCGGQWGATCESYVKDGLDEHHSTNPSPEITMFKPNRTDIPTGLRKGKTNEYTGPKDKSDLLGTFPKYGKTVVKAGKRKSSIKPMAKSAVRPKLNGTAANNLGIKRKAPLKLNRAIKRGGLRRMTSDNIFSRTGLTRPPQSGSPFYAAKAHRNPAWDDNGNTVKSCEEYAYEMTYDWTRYTDAAAACSGDHNCQMDVAFLPSTPGIAGRTLKSKDGTPLESQIKLKKRMVLPKNDFFAGGKGFARSGPGKPVERTADIIALEKALEQGEAYYAIGGSRRTPHSYADEWAFHRDLHDKNRTVTEAEFDEYELRKQKMRDLLIRWNVAVRKEIDHLTSKAKTGKSKRLTLPFEEVGNPLLTMSKLHNQVDSLSSYASKLRNTAKGKMNRGKMHKGKNNPASTPVQPKASPINNGRTITPSAGPKAGGLNRGKAGRRGMQLGQAEHPSSATEVLALAAKPGKPKPGASQNPGGAGALPLGRCHPSRFGVGSFEFAHAGPISCQIGELLREEWARKAAGERSCLDVGMDDCDWSPMLFEQRFVEGVPYIAEQNRHETECLDWTFDKINQESLKKATAYIGAERKKIKGALKKLKPYMKDWNPANPKAASPRSFGKSWTDEDHFGDKSLMAAGYDYDLGWDIEAIKVSGKEVCQLAGGARGGFGIDAWLMDSDYEIVDGLAKVDYGRNGKDEGAMGAHLRVFEQDVFTPIDAKRDKDKKDGKGKVVAYAGKFQGAWEKPLFDGSIQIPMGYKPSFYVMAGPVPISGSVWGEFAYGSKLRIETINEAPNCDMSDIRFGVGATFTPWLALNAKAQVGVGISGLLSAGIRGLINLVTVGVPVETSLTTNIRTDQNGTKTDLEFDLDVRLALETLSGWIAVYVEVLLWEEEFIIFRWNGLGPEEVSLFGEPLEVDLPLPVMGG